MEDLILSHTQKSKRIPTCLLRTLAPPPHPPHPHPNSGNTAASLWFPSQKLGLCT